MSAALRILRRICATLTGATGFGIVVLVLIAAIFAPWVSTADPDKLDVMNRFSAPSFAHWLGTDHLGRDLYSRLVHGATVALSSIVCRSLGQRRRIFSMSGRKPMSSIRSASSSTTI